MGNGHLIGKLATVREQFAREMANHSMACQMELMNRKRKNVFFYPLNLCTHTIDHN